MGARDSEAQLASFFAYSFLIYPATNYLLSPLRHYNTHTPASSSSSSNISWWRGRWRGILYATSFLALIAAGQLFLESAEQGPNFYGSLRATRHTPPDKLKLLYKKRMLETHPDKNSAPTAVEDFRRAKLSYEVLSRPDLRDIYDRLGEHGLHMFAGDVGQGQGRDKDRDKDSSAVRGVDPSVVMVQMLMWAGSGVVMAFVMTLSEPSGEAFAHSVFCVCVILLLELMFVVAAYPLPAWLLPSWSPHDIMSTLRQLYPAAMNASRCICSSLHEDPFVFRVEVMDRLVSTCSAVSKEAIKTVYAWQDRMASFGRNEACASTSVLLNSASQNPVDEALRRVKRKATTNNNSGSATTAYMQNLVDRVVTLDKKKCDPHIMQLQSRHDGEETGLAQLFSLPHLFVYLVLGGAYSYFRA
jgi:hypothetical protein